MEFRVLGPLEVDDEGRSLTIGGLKQRTVLALLVASGGRRISTDALITGVYGDEAAPGARRNIHTYVSNLRHVLGDRITRQGEGYVLSMAPDEVDAVRFESLYRDGIAHLADDPAEAAQLLSEALAVWRGHPYADIDGGPVIDAEIARLAELRVAALQARIDADLAVGLHQALVGELDALVTEYPYQETFRAQQMLALYRSDRQADALRAFTKTRLFLAEELGVDPGPELRRLEDQILRQDPALDLEVRPRIERRAVLVADLPDTMRNADPSVREAALAERDAELELHIAEHDGVVFGVRGTAVYAALTGIVGALDLARSLAHHDLKVAVDFGDVESRNGDVTGPPVGRSARLVATSHPGQVVLSQQAQAALGESGTTGWSVKSLGRHQLRGVDEPLMIYQAIGDGLAEEFPPLVLDRLPPPVPGAHPAIAGYELRERLEEDELSVVYRAYQHSAGREVTLRAFRHEVVSDPRFIRRFEAEAQRLALLDHPHIVGVLDYWREPERAVIVSPIASRRSLADVLASRSLSGIGLAVVEHVGAALAHAHDNGVVHGALTPSAVLLDTEGNPYLAGLGLASMTSGILVPRTGRYSAPEATARGPSPAGDLFSLGMVTADLLGVVPSGDGRLGDVIAVATNPDPSRRHPSVRAFLDTLADARGRSTMPAAPGLTDARNPYKGLEAFTEPDAADFFGREALVAELVDRVASGSFTLVVGPSGIGKSSAVRAGLIPALRSGALPGSEQWLFTDMFPGTSPFDELVAALARVSIRRPSGAVEALRSGGTSLSDAAARLTGGETVLIVIDQFEEIFTHGDSDEERRAFLSMLSAVARTDALHIRVVATLRADFFDRPLEDAEFGDAVRDRVVPVPAMSVAEFAAAVRRPAEQVGVVVDDELVTVMAEDTAREPGGLPLLEFTLAELFDHRDRDQLTLAGYRRDGGLAGSIGRRAERIYLELPQAVRGAARDVFIRLVTVDEDHEDTRRRVRRSELDQLSCGRAAVETVLDAFGRRRLLTFDRDPTSRGPTVELAHEAILREWDRLAGWVDAVRDDLLVRRRIDAAAREWDEAGRDASYLLGGARLEQAETWFSGSELELTETEADLLADSRRTADEQQWRRRRARRRVTAGLTAALVAVSALGLVAAARGRDAERRALENRTAELASEAILATDEDPDRAILLALEAYRTSEELAEVPPAEVVSALHTAVQASRLDRLIPDGRWAIDVSPDGRHVALDDADDRRRLVVYEVASGRQVGEQELPGPIAELRYSPDGSMIAATLADLAEGITVVLLDSGTLETVHELVPEEVDPLPSCCLDWSDDSQLVAAWNESGVGVWDAGSGDVRTQIEDGDYAVFVPGERTLALERDGVIDFVDIDSGNVDGDRRMVPPAELTPFVFSPDGRSMVFPDWGGREFHVVRLDSAEPPATFPHTSPNVAHFSPDGRSVAVGGNADAVTVVDLESGQATELHGHGTGSIGNAFASDDLLLTISWDGGTRVWELAPEGVAELGNVRIGGWSGSSMAVNGSTLLELHSTGPTEDTATAIDLATGTRRTIARFWDQPWFDAVVSPDGTLVGGHSPDATNRVASVVEVETGRTLLTLPPCENVEALDGVRHVALVERLCPVGSQIAHLPDARRGLVDVHTGKLLAAIEPARQIAHAVFGRPGTVAEDLLVLNTWPELDTDERAVFPSGTPHREVEFRTASTGELLATWPYDDDTVVGLSVTLSPDGRQASLAAQTGQSVIFDVEAILDGVPATEAATVFENLTTGPNHWTAPMGETFVTSAGGTQIRQWDTETGRLLADVAMGPGPSAYLVPLPDGSAVLYDDTSGVLRRLLMDPDDLVALAEQRLQRGFTEAECERYFPPGECPTQPASSQDG